MNKKLFVLAAFSALVLTGCPGNTPEPTPEPTPVIVVGGVTLDKTALNLKVDEVYQLVATVLPEDATDKSLTWSSADTSVATVDAEGNVTAVGAGSTFVTVASVSDPTKTAKCRVNVSGVNKLIEAFAGLGEKVKATVTLKAGQKDAYGDTLTEDKDFVVDFTPKYNFIEGVGGYAFIGDETNGRYYGVYEDEGAFENIWGVAYDTAEEFAAKESFRGFATFLETSQDEVVESAGTYKYAGQVKTEIARMLGVGDITASTIGAVSMSYSANGVLVDFLYQPTSSTPVVSYNLTSHEDLAYGALEEFLLTAEAKESPVSATQILRTNLVESHNYTTKYVVVSDGLNDCYQSTYTTDDTYSIAWDEGWAAAGYATSRSAQEYVYVPSGYTIDEGTYVAADWTTADPELMAKHVKEGFASEEEGEFTKLTSAEPHFWYNKKYKNPVSIAESAFEDEVTEKEYYADELFLHERFNREDGQFFQMKAGDVIEVVEITSTDPDSGAEVTQQYVVRVQAEWMTEFADCYGLIDTYDVPDDGLQQIDLFVTYKDETEAANNVDNLLFVYDFIGDWKYDGTPGNEQVTDWTLYKDFGTTVDPYAGTVLGNITEKFDITWFVNGVENTANAWCIEIGGEMTLTYTVPESSTGTLSVEDPTVISLDAEGHIVGLKAGVTNVYYTDSTSGVKVGFKVYVAQNPVGTWYMFDENGVETSLVVDETASSLTWGEETYQFFQLGTGVYAFIGYAAAQDEAVYFALQEKVGYLQYTDATTGEEVTIKIYNEAQRAAILAAKAKAVALNEGDEDSTYYMGDGAWYFMAMYGNIGTTIPEGYDSWAAFYTAQIAVVENAYGFTAESFVKVSNDAYSNGHVDGFTNTEDGLYYEVWIGDAITMFGMPAQYAGYALYLIQVQPVF